MSLVIQSQAVHLAHHNMKFYYLTMDEINSRERRKRTREEMKKVHYPTEEVLWVRKYIESTGCTYSQFLIAKEVHKNKEEIMGFFEDDVKILDEELFNQQVKIALEDKEWDIFYFSFHPPPPEFKIIDENENHYRIRGMLGTHAMIYRKRMINQILSTTATDGTFMGRINIDVAIRDHLHHFKCYCPKEIAVSFYDGRSSRADREWFEDIDNRIIKDFTLKKQLWTQHK